ncbi:MAG: signal peptidase II [Gammaproteobacteria bacterium]|nr:signal peptidase II [Gammaproteobacteria bacterium]
MAVDNAFISPRNLFALSALLVVADQLSKAWVRVSLDPFERIDLLPVLSLVRVHNSGMAFGLFDLPGGVQLFIIVPIAVLISGYLSREIWLKRAPDAWRAVGYAFVLAGAVGNLIDRVSLGHVVDFVLMHAFEWGFPAYNVADVCITFGVVAWMWSILNEAKTMRSAFGLAEVMVVLLIVAVLAVIAVPTYVGFTARAERTAGEGDLLRCGASIERRLLDGGSLAGISDSDGDGVGDAMIGVIAPEVCVASAGEYQVEVISADGDFYLLHAVPKDGSDLPLLGYDAEGHTFVDLDGDGDFDEPDERIW